MEKIINTSTVEKEALISAAFAEKKGRESFGDNPFTCYISINSPRPNLAYITASLLEELSNKTREAFLWTKKWDKSIVSVAPGHESGCLLLPSGDVKGKTFVPVTTIKTAEVESLIAQLPELAGDEVIINSKPMTIDAFLIVYLHLINELIWDKALAFSGGVNVNGETYEVALKEVCLKGFSVQLMSEEKILDVRKRDPLASMRIYGSKVNKFVPEVMGLVINK